MIGLGGVGLDVSYRGFTLLTILWISGRYKWRRHRFYHLRRQVQWWWSFPVHRIRREAAHRALIGCGTYYVVRRRTCQFYFFVGFLLLYIRT
jgi:hypothetical protein